MYDFVRQHCDDVVVFFRIQEDVEDGMVVLQALVEGMVLEVHVTNRQGLEAGSTPLVEIYTQFGSQVNVAENEHSWGEHESNECVAWCRFLQESIMPQIQYSIHQHVYTYFSLLSSLMYMYVSFVCTESNVYQPRARGTRLCFMEGRNEIRLWTGTLRKMDNDRNKFKTQMSLGFDLCSNPGT